MMPWSSVVSSQELLDAMTPEEFEVIVLVVVVIHALFMSCLTNRCINKWLVWMYKNYPHAVAFLVIFESLLYIQLFKTLQ
jgi:hypothetical protein